MRERAGTAVVVAAVALIFGIAIADALRDHLPRGGEEAQPSAAPTSAPREEPPADLVGLAGVRGSIVFTDPRDCRVREIDVATGDEIELPRIATDCRLLVSRQTSVVAYGVHGDGGLRFRDLEAANAPVTRAEAAAAFPTDAPSSRGRPVLAAADGPYGAAGVVVRAEDDRVVAERYVGSRLTSRTTIPPALVPGEYRFSPDACGLLARNGGRLRLLDLGCFPGRVRRWQALDADWSPAGEWVVMSAAAGITFERVVGARQPRRVVWPVGAAELGWRVDEP